MSYYPVLLDLENRNVAVVGGGENAEEKVGTLLEAGARVSIFAPYLSPSLSVMAAAGSVRHHPREIEVQDLENSALVLAERRDPATDHSLGEAAHLRNRFINVQDRVSASSFIAPAVMRRGDLVVAISTSGAAPALAVRLRQKFQKEIGNEYAPFLALARRFRRPLAQQVPDFEERRRRWYLLVDSEVLCLLAEGQERRALEAAIELMGVEPDA